MPLPTPQKDETKQDFISRCMGDDNAVEEFPDQEQRSGYCYSAWEDHLKKNQENSNQVRRLNFIDANVEQKLTISPDAIPTLVPTEIMNKWQEGDPAPYYKLQRIEYPIVANHLIYEESFFESFVNKLNQRPIPGSKSGHNVFTSGKAPTDFILVGGKLESNGDGTGNVYFKNYIPPKGESGDNAVFIRENQSDMIHYSLVTYPKEIIESGEDGMKIRIVESIKGERNDAVEYGVGAMKQVTNMLDETGNNDQNDVVDIKIISNEEIRKMDKAELLKRLNVLRANGDITLLEIAKALNMENQLATDEQREAVALVKRLNDAGVKDIEADLKRLQKEVSDGAAAKRENELTAEFGPKELPGGGENVLRDYVDSQYKGDTTIEQIKNTSVYKALKAQSADYTSAQNSIGMVEPDPKKNKSTGDDADSPQVQEY